jgi:tRNA G18 (ribose-2'-O)-methylase SpoU
MRGYFGIGVERFSKPMNAGNLFRTAHAFGASFVFAVDADPAIGKAGSDTSLTPKNLPFYSYDSMADFNLPDDCTLVGVELLDEAVELPVFRHPRRAAYVLGPERGSLSPEMQARCDTMVKIPTSFCLNVATAGAIIMYDRVLNLGRFAERPLSPIGDPVPRDAHVRGEPKIRSKVS